MIRRVVVDPAVVLVEPVVGFPIEDSLEASRFEDVGRHFPSGLVRRSRLVHPNRPVIQYNAINHEKRIKQPTTEHPMNEKTYRLGQKGGKRV